MQTLHHGFWIFFLTRHHPKVWQFVLGSMLPDYIYILLIGALLMKGYASWLDLSALTPRVIMSFIAIHPWVLTADLIGHSVPVWIGAFSLTLLPSIRRIRPFIIGWGTHLLIDAFTHGAYSNFYLYPISYYTVEGPISYWEDDYHFRQFSVANRAIMAAAASYMVYDYWKKYISN